MDSSLAFWIPTYNRPELLKRAYSSVREYKPEQTTEIWISDNSDDTVSPKMRDLVYNEEISTLYHKNPINTGGAFNIFQCALHLNADYFIILGDDDELTPESTGLLRDAIKLMDTDSLISAVCFSNIFKTRKIVKRGTDLIKGGRVEGWGDLLHISKWVFRKSSYEKGFPELVNSFTSQMSHLVPMIHSLESNRHKIAIHPGQIVIQNSDIGSWCYLRTYVQMISFIKSDYQIHQALKSALIRSALPFKRKIVLGYLGYNQVNIGSDALSMLSSLSRVSRTSWLALIILYLARPLRIPRLLKILFPDKLQRWDVSSKSFS